MLGSWCSGACRRDGDWSQTSRHLKEKETEASRADMMGRLGGGILQSYCYFEAKLVTRAPALCHCRPQRWWRCLHTPSVSHVLRLFDLLTANGFNCTWWIKAQCVYKHTVFVMFTGNNTQSHVVIVKLGFKFNCDNTDLQFCLLFLSMLMNFCISCKLPHWIFKKRDIQINLFDITSNFSPKKKSVVMC